MSGSAEGLLANSGADQATAPASVRILGKAEENFLEGMWYSNPFGSIHYRP